MIEIDMRSHTVVVDGRQVPMTPTEFDMLRVLKVNEGRMVRKKALSLAVWGEDRGMTTVYIWRVRHKLKSAGKRIRTIHRVGYRLD